MPTSTCTLIYHYIIPGRPVVRSGKSVLRSVLIPFRECERFYLRMLLLHVRGATSFNQLKTYEGVRHKTFGGACRARGLLIDDTEWDRTLAKAITTPRQVRELFVTILGSCESVSRVIRYSCGKTIKVTCQRTSYSIMI